VAPLFLCVEPRQTVHFNAESAHFERFNYGDQLLEAPHISFRFFNFSNDCFVCFGLKSIPLVHYHPQFIALMI
jgi:hypothetical protein